MQHTTAGAATGNGRSEPVCRPGRSRALTGLRVLDLGRLFAAPHIDIALLDVAMAAMSHRATEYLLTGISPVRMGSSSAGNVPARNFRCADGMLCVQAGGDANFARLCTALDRADLLSDPGFATRAARVDNVARLNEILERIFLRRPVEEWFQLLSEHGVYCGPVHNVAQSYADPQAIHRGTRMTVPHSKARTVDLIANPIRFCGLDGATQCTPPPDIGEHTDTILREELRMSEDDIAALRRSGVI